MAYDGDKTINGLTPIDNVTLETEIVVWDEADEEAKKGTVQQLKDVIAEGVSGGLAFTGTRAEYEQAKLIPVGQVGYISSGSLVRITDENRTYETSGTGSEQTLSLVARVMSAGDGISISNSDVIKADTVIFTGTRAEWEALSTAQKAKFNIVNITDEMECAYQDIYSETEVKTNKVWIDGKPIFRKVVDIGNLPNSTVKYVTHNITYDFITKLYGIAKNINTGTVYPLPRTTGDNNFVNLFCTTSQIGISTGVDQSVSSGYVVIEYTKSN